MKRWIKSLIRKFGFDIVQYQEVPDRPLSVFPYVLGAEAAADPNFFFVQIGAHDGVRNDPLWETVTRLRLRGLLVEPIPDLFAQLQDNYRDYPDLLFEQAAIAHRQGSVSLYRIAADAPLPAWVQGLASLNKQHLSGTKFGIPDLERHIQAIEVPSMTFTQLLKKHGVSRVSLLQVDTEGFDTEIVNMALESGILPRVIHYEYIHTPPPKRAALKRLLAEKGYSYLDVGRDTVAVRDT
jgi:FkbM family methyltransferase